MSSDAAKHFDPIGQFTELASFWSSLGNPYRGLVPGFPAKYELIDPKVQEIAILAAMHNMASLLSNPDKIKATISAELSERARKLAETK